MRMLRARLKDERGTALFLTAAGMVGFIGATMLALDVGRFMVARTQAQRSADAGALAGAVALTFDSFTDRSEDGPAVQNAITASTANPVFQDNVSVLPGDVTFPTIDRVRVTVHRTAARGNPLLTIIAPFFGVDEISMSAVATAEVLPADAATCIKPWAVPDKWEEHQTPAWDPNDQINMFYETGPNKGMPLPDPDIYRNAKTTGTPGYTGYKPNREGPDYGLQVLLKPGNPNTAINSSHFFPIALPPGTGGDWYEENIGGCWPGVAEIDNFVPFEPGNKTGPTKSGVEALIAKDPEAYWDEDEDRVVSTHRPSPRQVVIPVFDPWVYEDGRQHGRLDFKIANFVGFFIEDMIGNDVLGRVVPATGLRRAGGGGIPEGSFLKEIRLVE